MKRFLVYSAAVPSEPLLPLGDMQAGLIRFSFCRLKRTKLILVKGHITIIDWKNMSFHCSL